MGREFRIMMHRPEGLVDLVLLGDCGFGRNRKSLGRPPKGPKLGYTHKDLKVTIEIEIPTNEEKAEYLGVFEHEAHLEQPALIGRAKPSDDSGVHDLESINRYETSARMVMEILAKGINGGSPKARAHAYEVCYEPGQKIFKTICGPQSNL